MMQADHGIDAESRISDISLQPALLEKELNALDDSIKDDDDDNESENDNDDNNIISTPSTLFGPGVDSLWRKKRRANGGRTGLTAGKKLPAAVSKLLGNAHEAYINGDYVTAVKLYSEVTQHAPKLPDPYSTMALIHEETGDLVSALQLYVVAAKLTPGCDLWHKIGDMAFELREFPLALAAITRIMSQDKSVGVYTKKILVLVEVRNIKAAEATLSKLLHQHPSEYDFLLEFGIACQRNHFLSRAASAYVRYIDHTVAVLRHKHMAQVRQGMDRNAQVVSVPQEVDMCHRLLFACRKLGEVNLSSPPSAAQQLSAATPEATSTKQLIACINSCCDAARVCGLLVEDSSAASASVASQRIARATETKRHISIPMDVILLTCLCEMEQALSPPPAPSAHAHTGGGADRSISGSATRLYKSELLDILSVYGEWEVGSETNAGGGGAESCCGGGRKGVSIAVGGVADILQVLFPILSLLEQEEEAVSKRLNEAVCRGEEDGAVDIGQWVALHAVACEGGETPSEGGTGMQSDAAFTLRATEPSTPAAPGGQGSMESATDKTPVVAAPAAGRWCIECRNYLLCVLLSFDV